MTSEHSRKSSLSTGRNRSGSVNTPRFAAQAAHRGQLSTAERHTLPAPELVSSQNSADELGSNIPGSYPQEDVSQMLKNHHDIDNPKHLGTMKVDLPLEEQPGGARQGVGSLPGPNAECGVAILPDERHPDRLQEDAEDSPLPSKEHPSGSRVGVGSLPGKNFEAGVATLPEERINGRPFGQGHTGFEKTLGNERTHIDIDTPATRTQTQPAPKETIFSATQREIRRDPDFLSHRSAFFQPQPHPPHADAPSSTEGVGVRTFVQGAAGAMYVGAEGLVHGAQGALQSFEERFKGQDPVQATKDMIRNLEERFGAEDAVKRAKEQIQGLEGRVEAGAGEVVQGARGVIHNIEARFAPAHNSATNAENSSGNVTSRDVSAPQDSSGEIQLAHPTSMFVTTGTDATHSELSPSSPSPVPPTSTNEDSHRVSGVPSTLPLSLQQEYLRSSLVRAPDENALDTDKSDTTRMFADDGDNMAEGTPTRDDRGVPDIEGGGDMMRGVGGVQYYTQAQGGMLPGYPTPEGMAMLIGDRVKDDQARSAAAGGHAPVLTETNATRSGRARLLRDDSAATSEAVRGSYSSEFLSSSGDTADPSIDDRIIEERRETPVFEGGSIHADGKYEAVFRPLADCPELLGSSVLHHAHRRHELHRPSRSEETKDLSAQFAHPSQQERSSASVEDRARMEEGGNTDHPGGVDSGADRLRNEQLFNTDHPPPSRLPQLSSQFGNEQVAKTNHPNEIDELPTFVNPKSETAAGKYEATFHLAGMGPAQVPVSHSRRHPVPIQEQVAITSQPNEVEERPIFTGGSETTKGLYAPVGAPLGTAQKMDIGGTATMQQGPAAVKKEMPAYLGKPLSGELPVQEQPAPKKKTLN